MSTSESERRERSLYNLSRPLSALPELTMRTLMADMARSLKFPGPATALE
jgi:hypothetical protein